MAEQAIKPEPEIQIGFNAPFIKHQRSNFRITNVTKLKLMWIIKSTNKRILLQPAHGVMEADERVQMQVLCEAFDKEPTIADRLSVEWIECPTTHTAKTFDMKVFEAAPVIHRKVVKVEYNSS